MRLLPGACILFALCADAQPPLAKVQADIVNYLKPGQKISDLESGSVKLTDQWDVITAYKAVTCWGDVCMEKRYGLAHRVRKDTLYPDFKEIEVFKGKIFLSTDSWACLADENLKVSHAFLKAQYMSPYLLAVSNGQGYGVIDTLARQVIAMKYDSIRGIMWGTDFEKTPDFLAKQHGKWGVVDYNDKVVIKSEYEALVYLYSFGGFAGKKGKYAFVTPNKPPPTQFLYDSMFTDWSMSNFIVMKDHKIGLMGFEGKELVKPTFNSVTGTSLYGCRCVKLNGKYAVVSSRGENLSGFIYDDFKRYESVHDEMLLRKNGKWGFFGCHSKKEITPFIYDGITAFYGYEADMLLNGVKKKIKVDDKK